MSWIKIRTNLSADPRVFRIASVAGIPPAHAVGCLVAVWSYADEHSTDGRIRWFGAADVDRVAGVAGFAAAMSAVDWLAVDGADCVLPRFNDHNGETAKTRANGARRQRRYRDSGTRDASSVTGCGSQVTLDASLEKRREEKNREERARRGSKGGGL